VKLSLSARSCAPHQHDSNHSESFDESTDLRLALLFHPVIHIFVATVVVIGPICFNQASFCLTPSSIRSPSINSHQRLPRCTELLVWHFSCALRQWSACHRPVTTSDSIPVTRCAFTHHEAAPVKHWSALAELLARKSKTYCAAITNCDKIWLWVELEANRLHWICVNWFGMMN